MRVVLPAFSFPRRPQTRRGRACVGAFRERGGGAARRAIDGIFALLRGGANDLSGVAIDTDGVLEFNARVYAVARTFQPGQTLSYGEIAERLGDRTLARDVGPALGQNPIPLIVPCHRVLAAGGKTGGFSASGDVVTKRAY